MIRALILSLGLVAASGCGAIQDELEAGRKFGSGNDLDDCLYESLTRLGACESTSCEALSPGFARGCASTARHSDALCSRVPDSITKAASWMKARCEWNKNPKACYKIYQQPVARCFDRAS